VSPEQRIFQLIDYGLFKDAAEEIDKRSDCPRFLRIIRSQLEAHVGAPALARREAENFLRESLTAREKAHCLEIIARGQLSSGDSKEGLSTFRRAISLAQGYHDLRLEARLVASLAEALLHWVGIEPAAAEISTLRKTAVKAGDEHSLISLHSLTAEIHAKRRSLHKAYASLNTARSLLRTFGNVWQQGRLAITSAGVAIVNSDYRSALDFTFEALDCADKSGSRELRTPALGNLAHIRLVEQDLDASEDALRNVLSLVRKGGSSEICARDTQMQVAIARNDVDAAAALSDEIRVLSQQLENGHSYYGLWHLLTRVKWLYRIDDAASGLALAQESLPIIERMADRNLLERMRLMIAEGLGRVGRADDGAVVMAEAFAANADPPLEMIAEVSRVAGRLAAVDSLDVAATHFDRAARIFQSVGNLTARAEVERDAQEAASRRATSGARDADHQADCQVDHRPPAAPLAERIATLIDLAAHPPLLASETLSLLADTQAACDGAIVATSADGEADTIDRFGTAESDHAAPAPRSATVRIRIGVHRDRTYDVIVTPQRSAAARASVLAVERLVQASLVLADTRQRQREQADLWPEPTPEQQLGLICASESMVDLIKTARRIAPSSIPVLITGETGVGKELFARALHQASARHERPFVSFNCATVPRELIDSHLFGHRRGAFSGAHDDFSGVIRAAAGGTLFLDEIGELTLDTQPKLLRFLESGEIVPLGEAKAQIVDIRVVAATNANLEQLVADGKFREDLYYRLNVIRLQVPPLRERREEIPLLVQHFIDRYTREMHKPLVRVAEDTLEYLVLYRWPGNVRQLANELRRMIALAEPGAVLMPEHLSQEIFASRRTVPASERQLEPTEMVVRIDQPLAAAVEHLERAFIRRAMSLTNSKVEDAARMLGLSRKGLYLKRQRLKLD
jgi:hydrogenase-4 transcriptional activator